jgi:hypothetical protein
MNIERIQNLINELKHAVLHRRGVTALSVRQAALADAACTAEVSTGDGGALPPDLAAYVATVARHAYRVTDAQVAGLLAAGHSEDVVFEVTVSAALGAGLARWERGLAALEGANDAAQALGA